MHPNWPLAARSVRGNNAGNVADCSCSRARRQSILSGEQGDTKMHSSIVKLRAAPMLGDAVTVAAGAGPPATRHAPTSADPTLDALAALDAGSARRAAQAPTAPLAAGHAAGNTAESVRAAGARVPADALLAQALEYVVTGEALARYVASRVVDEALRAMLDDFAASGESLSQLLREQLAEKVVS